MGKLVIRMVSIIVFSIIFQIGHIGANLTEFYLMAYFGLFFLGFTVSTIIFSELERLEFWTLSKGVKIPELDIMGGGKKDVQKIKDKRVKQNVRKTK